MPTRALLPRPAWRSALGTLAFAIVPITVGGLVPLALTGWQSSWSATIPRLIGALLAFAGALVVFDSFVRFAREGRGTPAPTAPTEQLVVGGLYRWVRNPMYVGVGVAITGQALILGSLLVLAYGALFYAVVSAFVITYEEPVLSRRFGASYDAYREAVPRWLPRLTPWQGPRARP